MTDTWVTPRVWVTSERVGQSKMNEISNDLRVLFPYTTGGDISYRDPAGAYLSRLAKPASLGLLKNDNAGVPSYVTGGNAYQTLRKNSANNGFEWGDFIVKRQGGGDIIWTAQGSTSYNVSGVVVQMGAKRISVTSGIGSAAVTYPTSFASLTNERPALLHSPNISSSEPYNWSLGWTDDTLTGHTIHLKFNGPVTQDYTVIWWAVSGISTF